MSEPCWIRRQLSGGLLLSCREHRSPGLLAARLWIAGGSSVDPSDQRGVHQLLAGLLTRGCGDLDADGLADLVEGRGAALRAEAGEDSLVISLKCASEDADVLLPLLVQMASRPTLEPDQIAIERQLNLQALQRQREDPFQLCHESLRQQLYGEGPYGHDPLGVADELEQLQRTDLRDQLSLLGRRGAALVLAGGVSQGALEALEAAISRGVPIFNHGDHAQCADIYKTCLEILANDEKVDSEVRKTLGKVLERAKGIEGARDRAWHLRKGLDYAYHAVAG